MDMPSRRLVLCADDFGLSEPISRGILDLAAIGRISATSVMTNFSDHARVAPELLPYRGRVAIGLHLTLSEGAPLGPMPRLAPEGRFPAVGVVIRQALLRQLDEAEIGGEIARQLDAFEAAFGSPPDFVDGHQHVHALPGICSALLAVLTRRGLGGKLWLRDPTDRPGAILGRGVAAGKALTVAALARGFRRQAEAAGFATNQGFSGFSPFDPGRDTGRDMARYLAQLGERPLVMCHPGREGAAADAIGAPDAIGPARVVERDYLASGAFGALLDRQGLTLVTQPG